jgi:RNA polymerase sigma-70 factor (ECF subfamily)
VKVRYLFTDKKKLVAKAQSHDIAAQKTLYDLFAPRMLSVCRYYIRDLQYAEDVLLTGFFKALTHLHQLDDPEKFEGWLRKIIVRESLSFLRQANHLIYTEDEYPFEEAVEESDGDWSLDDLQLLIDQLPENQKVVFVLYVVEGYSHKEIGDTLDIPVGSSKSYLSRARKTLKENIHQFYSKKNEQSKV